MQRYTGMFAKTWLGVTQCVQMCVYILLENRKIGIMITDDYGPKAKSITNQLRGSSLQSHTRVCLKCMEGKNVHDFNSTERNFATLSGR